MDDLIRITINDGGKRTVSARELYAFLGVKTPFRKWIKRMTSVHFIEGVDYEIIMVKNDRNSKRGPKRMDWLITVDMAKKIGMMQNSPKGSEIQDYFIQCEKENETIHNSIGGQNRPAR